MGIEFWYSREAQTAELRCSRCEEDYGIKSKVAVVMNKTVLVPRRVGSNKRVVLERPPEAIAQDPQMVDPARVITHRKAVKEGREDPLPGVKVEKGSRMSWRRLVGDHEIVSCSRGHRVRVSAKRYEGIVYLDHHGKQVRI
jgi:hypothetical protein